MLLLLLLLLAAAGVDDEDVYMHLSPHSDQDMCGQSQFCQPMHITFRMPHQLPPHTLLNPQ